MNQTTTKTSNKNKSNNNDKNPGETNYKHVTNNNNKGDSNGDARKGPLTRNRKRREMLMEESAKDHDHCDDSTIISDGYTDTGSTVTISPDRFLGVTGERPSDSDSVDTINIWASQPPHPAPTRTPEPQPPSPLSLSSLSSLALPDNLPRTPRLSLSSSSSSFSSTSSHDTDRTAECTSPKGTIPPSTTTTTTITRNKDKRKGDEPFSMEEWRNTPSCSYAWTGDREKETARRTERPPPTVTAQGATEEYRWRIRGHWEGKNHQQQRGGGKRERDRQKIAPNTRNRTHRGKRGKDDLGYPPLLRRPSPPLLNLLTHTTQYHRRREQAQE
ncbi:unnamed protein product [Diatraea saccharalis]|uniref:Uncharacterized protein n=1 Tax=Diatraea saccharalis TaxID=40085 RepID=A0A9N9QVI5_9NEOP|nr:unnamed protein product [Diatraea saccharalis]